MDGIEGMMLDKPAIYLGSISGIIWSSEQCQNKVNLDCIARSKHSAAIGMPHQKKVKYYKRQSEKKKRIVLRS